MSAQWPAMLYHRDGRQRTVHTPEEAQTLTDRGWGNRPFRQTAPVVGPAPASAFDCVNCRMLKDAYGHVASRLEKAIADLETAKSDHDALVDTYEQLLNSHQKLLVETASRRGEFEPPKEIEPEGELERNFTGPQGQREGGPPPAAITKAREVQAKARRK